MADLSTSFNPSLVALNSDAASSALAEADTASAVAAAASSKIAAQSSAWEAGTLGNVVEDTTPQAGGEFDFQDHSVGFTMQTATGDGTTTIDWKKGNGFKFTFGAQNETFTFTAPTKTCRLMLTLIQDGVGSRTVTWPATIKWGGGGTAPTLTTAANARDKIAFEWDGTQYDALVAKNFK